MSAKLRDQAFENLIYLKAIGSIDFKSRLLPFKIDSFNISGATRLSFDRSLKAILKRNHC